MTSKQRHKYRTTSQTPQRRRSFFLSAVQHPAGDVFHNLKNDGNDAPNGQSDGEAADESLPGEGVNPQPADESLRPRVMEDEPSEVRLRQTAWSTGRPSGGQTYGGPPLGVQRRRDR